MNELNIFTILQLNGGRKGGTIHDILREITEVATHGYQQGKLCYKFSLDGVLFEGCVDGRLVSTKPDTHLSGVTNLVCVKSLHKDMIEGAIFDRRSLA